MARNDKYIIELQATIDVSDKSIQNLNEQIKTIEANAKLKALNLKIKLDENDMKKITKQLQNFKNQSQKIANEIMNNAKIKNLNITEDVEKYLKQIGLSKENIGKIVYYYDELRKKGEDLRKIVTTITDNEGKQIQLVEKYQDELQGFLVTNRIIVDDQEKRRKKAQKELEIEQKKKKLLEEQIRIFKTQAKVKMEGMYERNMKFITPEHMKQMEKFRQELGRLNARDLEEGKYKLEELKVKLRELNSMFNSASRTTLGFTKAFTEAVRKFSIWIGASTLFFQTLRFYKNGVKYVNELNKSLTTISVVTGKSQEEVRQLGLEYQRLAKEMGVLTSEIAEGSVEFYRQGLSTEEVMNRMTLAIKASKVAGVEFKRVVELLTAVVNSMNVSIEHASDVFSYLGDATATSYEEIATAFQKVGGTAGALGLEFEKVASYIAVISARTRESAESIGTSLKTIFARMGKLTEKGFDEEDETNINDVAKALSRANVALTNLDGTFRNFGDVLDDLGKKWKTLDNNAKLYIANAIAGQRQQARFLNLMEGYEESVKLYENALESAGATQEKYNLWLQGTEAKLNELKTTATGVWQKAFNDEDIRDFIDVLIKVVGAFGEIVDQVGIFNLSMAVATMAFIKFNKKAKAFTNTFAKQLYLKFEPLRIVIEKTRIGLVKFGIALEKNRFAGTAFGRTLTKLGIGFQKLGFSATLAKMAMLGLQAVISVAIPVALSFIIDKIIALINRSNELKERNKELIQTFKETTDSIKNKIKSLQDLSQEYETLRNKTNKSIKEQERLYEIQNQIAEILPEMVKGYDENGNAILDNTKSLQEYNETLKEKLSLERQNLIIKGQDLYKEYLDERKKSIKKIKEIEEEIKKIQQGYTAGSGNYTYYIKGLKDYEEELKRLREEEGKDNSKRIAELENIIKQKRAKIKNLQREVNVVKESMKEAGMGVYQAFQAMAMESENWDNLTKDLKEHVFDYINILKLEGKTYLQVQSEIEEYVDTLSKIKDLSQEKLDKKNNLVNQLLKGEISAGEYNKRIKKLYQSVKEFENIPADIITRLFPDFDTIKEQFVKNNIDKEIGFSVLHEKIKFAINDTKKFNEILEDVTKNEKYNKEAIIDLAEKYPKLLTVLNNRKELLKELHKIQKDNVESNIKLMEDEVEAQKRALLAKVELIGAEIDLNESLVEIKQKLIKQRMKQEISQMEYASLSYLTYLNKKIKEEINGLDDEISTLKQQKKIIDNIKSIFDDLGTDKSKDTYKAKADSLLEFKNAIDSTKNAITLLENKLKTFGKDDPKRIEILKQEQELYKQQQTNLHNLAEEYRKQRKELKSYLENFGFKFKGQGDQMMITNLENIEGKSKEVEEAFKQFLNIQLKELPSLKNEWWGLSQNIEEVGNTIDKIKINNALKDSKDNIDETNKALKTLEHQMNLLNTGQEAKQVELLEQKIKLNEKLIKQIDERIDKIKQLIIIYQNNKEVAEELNSELEQLVEQRQSALETIVSTIEEKRNAIFNIVQTVEDKIIEMIRKRNEQEEELLEKSHKEELERLDERLQAYKEYIQGRINALEDAYNEENYRKQYRDKQEELLEIEKEMALLRMDDSLSAQYKLQELEKKAFEKRLEIAEMEREHSIEQQKKKYQEMLDIEEKKVNAHKDALEREYEKEKALMEKRHSDMQVYIEAQEALITGTFRTLEGLTIDITDAFVEFENKWGKGLTTLGSLIKNEFIANLNLAKQVLLDFNNLTNMSSGLGLPINNSREGLLGVRNYLESKGFDVTWDSETHRVKISKNGKSGYLDTSEFTLGADNHYYGTYEAIKRALKKIGFYAEGGVNDYTGLAFLHGTRRSSEVIFNAEDAKKLYNIVRQLPIRSPKLPDVTEVINYNIDIQSLITINGKVDDRMIPKIRREGENILEKLTRELKKKGINRKL